MSVKFVPRLFPECLAVCLICLFVFFLIFRSRNYSVRFQDALRFIRLIPLFFRFRRLYNYIIAEIDSQTVELFLYSIVL